MLTTVHVCSPKPGALRAGAFAGGRVGTDSALTIADLGVLRDVVVEDGQVVVVITPTYSGCPAMKTIEDDIVAAVEQAGLGPVSVRSCCRRPGPPTGSPSVDTQNRPLIDTAKPAIS